MRASERVEGASFTTLARELSRNEERPAPRAVEATNVVMTSKRTPALPPSPPPPPSAPLAPSPSSSTPNNAAFSFSLPLSPPLSRYPPVPVLGNHSRLHNPLRRSSHRSLARSRTRGVSTSSSSSSSSTRDERRETKDVRRGREEKRETVSPPFFRFGNTSSSDLAFRYAKEMGGDEGSASQTSLLHPQELFATDFAVHVVRRIRSCELRLWLGYISMLKLEQQPVTHTGLTRGGAGANKAGGISWCRR